MPEETKNATHVYVRLDKGNPLAPRFAGPYPIVSRPSKSTITIKEGTFVSGLPKLRTHHWSLCQVAHMRPGAKDAEKPRRGRPPKPSTAQSILTTDSSNMDDETPSNRSDELLDDQPTSLAPNQNQNKTATFDDDELTQPLTTNDVNSSQPGRSPTSESPTGSAPTPDRWRPQPPPSPALKGTPHPFRLAESSEDEYDSDDEPFHGFQNTEADTTSPPPGSIAPPPGFDYNQSQGRPKRNTRKPDRLEYSSFAVRSV